MRARPAQLMALLAVASLTACGSTVDLARSESDPRGWDGLGDMRGTAPPTSTSAPGTTIEPLPGGGSGVTTPHGGPVAEPVGEAGVDPGGAPPSVAADALAGLPGITPTTVRIGFEGAGNAAATRAAFGLPASTAPALSDALRVIFDYVNKRGGFGGRKGEFVIHETDVTEGTFAEQAERACTAFTQDHKVFAAIAAVARDTSIFPCLAKRRTVGLAYYPGIAIPTRYWDSLADYFYGPVLLGHQRSAFLVDVWIKMGLLKPDSRIGLISINEPTRQAFAQAIRDRLRQRGLKLTDEFKASDASAVGDLGRAGQEMSSAVLRFQASRVDVVLFANTAGGGPSLFMPTAESQQYRPNYGISSYEFLRTAVTLAPKEALARSVGPGWLHGYDLTDASSLPKNPERDKCVKIFRDGGITVDDKTTLTIGAVCEAVFLLRDGMNAVASGGAKSFRAGVEGLGRFLTASTDPLLFGVGRRHDAIGLYRETRFDSDCGCFHYVSPAMPIP